MQATHRVGEIRSELDSHADTCVVGDSTCLLTHDFDRPVRVYAFDGTKSATSRTVTGILGYTNPMCGTRYLLVIHQAILVPKMTTNLIAIMQLRDNGVMVNDEPKHMALTPTHEHHCISIADTKGTDGLRIPLLIKGVISYFPTWKPTTKEYETMPSHRIIELTNETIDWDPQLETRFEQQEDIILSSAEFCSSNQNEQSKISSITTVPQVSQPEQEFYLALVSRISSLNTKHSKGSITPKDLCLRWGIGLHAAARTIDATRQKGLRTILHPTLSRRFRTNDRQLRYRRLSCEVFADTLEASVPSWHRQNKYAQVFTTRHGWTRVYPIRKKSDAHEGLSLLAQRDGVPLSIVMDGSKEQTMSEFRRKAKEMGCHIKVTEPYSPWQNAAEGAIRELKRGAGRKMTKSKSPMKLWDHCLELEGYLRSHTALDSYELHGQVPETIVSGQTADISPFAEHGWYDWIMWYDSETQFPEPREKLGRWLGPAVDIGPAMTAKILKSNGQVVYRSTYRALTQDEMDDPSSISLRKIFDEEITVKIGGPPIHSDLLSLDNDTATPEYEVYCDEVEGTQGNDFHTKEVTPEDQDSYLGARVSLQIGGDVQDGTVTCRARNTDGGSKGLENPNPILDTRDYKVEFQDGRVAEYSANAIAESMYAQCDPQGNQQLLMDALIDHMRDGTAVIYADNKRIVNGRQQPCKSTRGWKLCVQWKDGSTSWERLTDMKESYPVEVAEYAVAQSIDREPAFSWWVPYTLQKRSKIVAAVRQRYLKRTHKFGIEVPKTIERALEVDKANGNNLWRDSIAKEMQAVRVAFKILPEDESPPPGYQYMKCHMIFDVKLDGFRRKARLVAGGHMTVAPAVLTYASVVSRESVRIALTVAALNDLQVKGSDVQNAYLTAPCEEKIWTTLGLEFGSDCGKKAIITRALYGLKSAGASFNRHISDCMRHLKYLPCKADPDLWYKSVIRPDDSISYYAYMLLYVDDCLCIHHDAESALLELDKYFQMKPGSIGDPDIYLGAKLRLVQLDNGVSAWSASPSKYVQDAVANVDAYLREHFPDKKLKSRVSGPWPSGYVIEMDISPELDPDNANYYQSQVGVLHWMVELGRVDIITEVSILASQMALPREGHLDALFHVFSYLRKRHNSRLVFDPTYPEIDGNQFIEHDWKHFYGNVCEAIPPDMPKPKGKEVDIRMFVDSDHAGDTSNRRSRSGFFIFINSALIGWCSKKQATVESSVFGAEFVALKLGIETLRGLRYKLRMMGVPISGPSYIYGDNMSVIHNTQRPESVLHKKSNQICYHMAREAVAMNECLTTHISTNDNPADLATKLISGGQKRDYLVGKLIYDICDEHP